MLGGEKLYITLTKGILGHISQINTERISIYIFRPIRHHQENTDLYVHDIYIHVCILMMMP